MHRALCEAVLTTRASRLLAGASGVAFVAILWLFVYNSGYGYDALEYLIIGRSLNDGYPLYAFVPSKSWALYVTVASFLRLPGSDGHLAISGFITALLVAVMVGTYRVTSRMFGREVATGATALVGLAGVFMELNFLEPEPFVYGAGLVALGVLGDRSRRLRTSSWLYAGLAIGTGMAFKVVAAFYVVGVAAWLFTDRRVRDECSWSGRIRRLTALAAGIALVVVPPAVWFAATGRFEPFVEWSFTFPLLHYPVNTEWAAQTLRKLTWVWLLVAAALATSAVPEIRRRTYADERVGLILALGGVGLLPLFKTWASHYAFPGSAFLLIFSAFVFQTWRAQARVNPATVRNAVAAMLLLGLASGIVYRPSAVRRLFTVTSFERDEAAVREAVQQAVRPGERAIFLGGRSTLLYWTTHRYPAWDVLNTDVQTTYLVNNARLDVGRVFDDTRVALVEFDPDQPFFNDSRFLDSAPARDFVRAVSCRLSSDFDRDDDSRVPLVLWHRRDSTARHAPADDCAG